MKVAQVWVESSANTYDVFLAVATIYLALTTVIGLGAKVAERRLAFVA
jgi:ABC-type amino acid transport system permease subunit